MRFAILLVIFAAVFVLGRPLDDLAQTSATYHSIDAADKSRLGAALSKVAGHVKAAATKVAGLFKKKTAVAVAAPPADTSTDAAPAEVPADTSAEPAA